MDESGATPDSRWTYPGNIGYISWVRTYWQPGTGWATCLYAARDANAIELYHNVCGVPYVEFNEITELVPEVTDAKTFEGAEPGHDAPLFAVDTPVPAAADVDARLFADATRFLSIAGCPDVADTSGAVRWIRTYWDEGRSRALALYAAPSPDFIEDLAATCPPDITVRPVTELRPEEYVGL